MTENAKKWLAALRSGEFKRGVNRLMTVHPDGDVTYCCLGVACELYRRENPYGNNWVPERHRTDGLIRAGAFELSDGTTVELALPEEVRTWLGLRDEDGLFDYGLLTSINDKFDGTFAEIATLIENEPAGLFKEQAAV